MLKTDLLPILNAEATHLGIEPVTDRMWRDWIDEKLIEGPKSKGRRRGENPLWEYRPGTTERALTILKLKSGGASRYSLLRLQLWLRGYDLSVATLRKDLASEFERLLKRYFFQRPSTYDASEANADDRKTRERHRKKIGPVDATLDAANLTPSDDIILAFTSKFVWGADKKSDSFELLAKELNEKFGIPLWIIDILRADLKPYLSCVDGFLGNLDEIERSGLFELNRVDLHALKVGRTFYQASLSLFKTGSKILSLSTSPETASLSTAIDKIACSLSHFEWLIFLLALGAVASVRNRQDTDSHSKSNALK